MVKSFIELCNNNKQKVAFRYLKNSKLKCKKYSQLLDDIYRFCNLFIYNNLKPNDKIILITDALRMKNMPEGKYEEDEQTIYLKNDEARLSNGVLAGSVLKLNKAVKNVTEYTNCDLEKAIKFATENPAKNIGLFNDMGSIEENKLANLVVVDKKMNIYLTIRRGKVIYINSNLLKL